MINGEKLSAHLPKTETGIKEIDRICSLGIVDISSGMCCGVDRHKCSGVQLSYVSMGKTELSIGHQKHVLKAGDLAVTRPWQDQSVGSPNMQACQMYWINLDVGARWPEPGKFIWPDWMIFTKRDLDFLTSVICTGGECVWQAGIDVGDCFKKIHKDLVIESEASRETHLRLHINELFVRFFDILRIAGSGSQSVRPTARQAVDIFLSDLPNHLEINWTLDLMADKCGLKKSSFNEYCNQITGQTPIEYLMGCRIRKAEELLINNPKIGIAEIAAACGYRTPQYFATIFKREIGMKPTQFRASLKKI